MTDEAEAKRFEEITSYHIDAVKKDSDLHLLQEEKDAAQKANDEHVALLKGLEKETIAYTDAGIALDYASKDADKTKLRADFDKAEHTLEEGIAKKLGSDPQAEEKIKGALSVPDAYIQESVSGNAQEVRTQSGAERTNYLEQAAKYFHDEGAISKAKLHVDEATMEFIQQARVEGLKLGIPKDKFDDVAANILSRAEGVPDSFLNQDPQVKDWETKLRGATGDELGKLGDALQVEKTAYYKFTDQEKALDKTDADYNAKLSNLIEKYDPAEREAIRHAAETQDVVQVRKMVENDKDSDKSRQSAAAIKLDVAEVENPSALQTHSSLSLPAKQASKDKDLALT